MRPRVIAGAVVATIALAMLAPGVSAAPVAVYGKNVEWRFTQPSAAGASLDSFERRHPDGGVRRYAAVGVMGYGVDFVDITNPDLPTVVGRHVSPGVNYHTDVHVNQKRDILVFSVDSPGTSISQGIATGIEFVDIKDLANPVRLSLVPNLEGPHKLALIGDNHVYTTLPTYIVDYSDPRNPKDLGRSKDVCGHGFGVDPSNPDRAYVASCSLFKWQVIDVSDPAAPQVVKEIRDLDIEVPHEAYAAPDSSFVGISDLRGDYANTRCPGGGIHFYDISGKYVEGASLADPKKMGTWFAPFTGAGNDPATSNPWGSCTLHGWNFDAERFLVGVGLYTGGMWVADVEHKTAAGGAYAEYSATPGRGLGPTTWGNTLGNYLGVGEFVWYAKWAQFDDARYDRYLFTNGPTRGFEVLRYTGPLPKKVARLSLDATAANGVVAGRLARYPVLTPEGYVNKPLADKTVAIAVGDRTLTAATRPDGSFEADLGLPSGTHEVTARWPGDDAYRPISVTIAVRV